MTKVSSWREHTLGVPQAAAHETTSMHIESTTAAREHDLRLDLFVGLANRSIFLDQIPDDAVNRITIRNFGFSGAADVSVFISGWRRFSSVKPASPS
jgi:hypothetical protein